MNALPHAHLSPDQPLISSHLFGEKARWLHLLFLKGFPLPPTWVISLPLDEPTLHIQHALTHTLNKLTPSLPSSPLAVRSSSCWEDGESSSGAGQFLSFLHRQGVQEISDAAVSIWNHAQQHTPCLSLKGWKMGVIFQPMVEGSHSGVCFTSHLSHPQSMALEYTEGSCSAVVEGRANTQLHTLSHKELEKLSDASKLPFLSHVALGCWQLRNSVKKELDIEWTYSLENGLTFLQARPITTLHSQQKKQDVWKQECTELQSQTQCGDLLTSLSIGEVFGYPKTLFQELIQQALEEEGPLHHYFRSLHLPYSPEGTPFFLNFCARPFINLSAYARTLGLQIRFSLSSKKVIQWKLSWRNLPTLFRLLKLLLTLPIRYTLFFKKVLSISPHSWTPSSDFKKNWLELKESLLYKKVLLHLESDVLSSLSQGLLLKSLQLFCGSSQRGFKIYSSLHFGFTNPNVTTSMDLYLLGKSQISWEEFVCRQGQRGHPDWDIAAKRFWETPEKIRQLASITAQAHRSPQWREKRRQRKGALLDFFLSKRRWYRWLRPFLKRDSQLIFYREQTQIDLYHSINHLRKQLLEHSSQQSFPQELIFFLKEEELFQLPEEKESLLKRAKKRQHTHLQQRRLSPAVTFFSHQPQQLENSPPPSSPKPLSGLGISPGSYQGVAYVAKNLEEALQMPEGAILVVHHIDPAWGALLCLAGAIVCEQGGLFCHSSILIREQGIPAAVNIVGITQSIQTGDLLTVDGEKGEVTLTFSNS